MSATHPPVNEAPVPFSGEPDSGSVNPPCDLILRSSNHVDFHVHKQMLAFASVFFSDMFAFPAGNVPPTETDRDGKPVLLLPESDEVLYRLLRLAYPGRSRQQYSFTAADLDSVTAVHEAAQKYQFIDAQQLIVEMLLDDALLQEHPHRLFAIGLLRNPPALIQKAALQTLRSPICPIDLNFPEFHLISGANLHKLYAFHRSRGARACEFLQGLICPQHKEVIDLVPHCFTYDREDGSPRAFVWWRGSNHDAKCGGPTEDNWDLVTVTPAKWFFTHIERLARKVSAIPVGQTVLNGIGAFDEDVASMIKDCGPCSVCKDGQLEELAESVAPQIDKSHEEAVKKWVFC
ncbi:hypothetical protein FB45DRAFT_804815 [Roridomyces roridus]|uniref:BTB domain-containing protein n=1 Tax=Roridomyces roridus TaxID=1738132 RepID=A0AAD7F920_9AGAR|nr:hypothetical protein FB45DRAFT_804815 [Roridomyces roridus]